MLDSSPIANKNLLERKAPAHLEDLADKTAVLPSPPDTLGDGTASKQGVTALKARCKRKAATEEAGAGAGAEPAAKRKRAAPKKPAAPRKMRKSVKKAGDVADGEEDLDADLDDAPWPSLEPLSKAVKAKVEAVDEFVRTQKDPLLTREEGSRSVAVVGELDLFASLIILRVDSQLEFPATTVSLEDAGGMIVSRDGAGKVRVDFAQSCDIGKAAQEKLAGRHTGGLEEVNLIEVDIEMLVARRQQLVKDGKPAGGFRVYDVDDDLFNEESARAEVEVVV